MTTYILGAGPAGLAVADGLNDANDGKFVLLEKESCLGGLAQTVTWNNIGTHDLGPHKIFSLDRKLVGRVEGLLPNSEWLTRDKISTIYMNGHYLPYPPSPFSLSGVFGLPVFIRMVAGYGTARLANLVGLKNPNTFEEDLVNRMGRPLYEVLFKPIAVKLWGNPRELDIKLSRGRIQTPSLIEVLGRLLKLKKGSEFEALTFRYPKGGLGRLWSAIEAKTRAKGKFLLEHSVTRLVADNGRIQEIHYQFNGAQGRIEVGPDDYVASTLPLSLTIKLLGDSLPQHVPELADKVLTLNDLLLVFLYIDRSNLLDESWVFVPDPDIIFHRLSEQKSFDPEMTKNGSIVCCEIMSGPSRSLAKKSDEDLCAVAAQGLTDMGYSGFRILDQRVIRLPKSYPVFRVGFEAGLAELIQSLDQFENFRTIGRQGAFNYIGTLDAMDIGYGFADWLVNGKHQPWQQERERTKHYPVLD
jgi:protoporphyrinogen oxidase